MTPDGDFRTGLLPTPEEEKVNTPEEREYLENVYAKYDRKRMPRTWDSRALGNNFVLLETNYCCN